MRTYSAQYNSNDENGKVYSLDDIEAKRPYRGCHLGRFAFHATGSGV